jgi:GTP-binding protein
MNSNPKIAKQRLQILSADYERALGIEELSKHTAPDLLEIACIGRSNVGKSTLINALLSRKKLAHVSATPGHTRSLNMYRVKAKYESRGAEFRFIDLPGYGYAKFSRSKRSEISQDIVTYISTRPDLAVLLLLIDLRRDPTVDDYAIRELCGRRGLPCVVVGTKADKLTKSELTLRTSTLAEQLGLESGDLLTSGKAIGIDTCWEVLSSYIID